MDTIQSLNDIAYTYICQLLVEERILPNQRLSEQNLAKALGISRTPVREAIRRLQSEGILRQIPSSGTYLREPNCDDIQELYEIREALECYLIKKAVPLMTHADFKLLRKQYNAMKDAVDRMKKAKDVYLTGEPLGQFLKADWSFHRQLIEPANNQHAMKILDDAQLKGCVFGIRSHRRNYEHLQRVLLLHKKVALSVINGNATGASNWLRTHIRESRRDALAAIREMINKTKKHGQSSSSFSALVENNRRLPKGMTDISLLEPKEKNDAGQ